MVTCPFTANVLWLCRLVGPGHYLLIAHSRCPMGNFLFVPWNNSAIIEVDVLFFFSNQAGPWEKSSDTVNTLHHTPYICTLLPLF